jgi:hypothetical protein
LSKSCQQVVNKLSKSCYKVVKICQNFFKNLVKLKCSGKFLKAGNSETVRRRRRRRRTRRRRFVVPRPGATLSHLVKIRLFRLILHSKVRN